MIKKIKCMFLIAVFIMVMCCLGKVTYAKDRIIDESEAYLIDEDGNVVAYYYRIDNGGYIVIDATGEQFIEYSLECDRLKLEQGKAYYYKKSESLNYKCNTVDGYKVEQMSKQNYNKMSDSASDIFNSLLGVSVIEEKSLSKTTYNFSYNPDGRCGSVAAAILLRYYHDNVNESYIADPNLLYYNVYFNYDGRNLINHINDNFIKGGVGYNQLKNGLNNYLKNVGVNTKAKELQGKNSSKVFTKVKAWINNDVPVIIGLTNHPTYSEHWCVGTGYRTVWSGSLGLGYIVIVNDGWGNRNINVNLKYIDGCVYLE